MSEFVKAVKAKYEEKMDGALKHLDHEMERLKAGRATVHTLEPVRVDSYGTLVPLNQVATITFTEPRLIQITPFNKTAIKEIEKGIINANLGLNPSSDGNVVRVQIPALTEDRRKEIVKRVKKEGENAKIALRTIRHEALAEIDKLEKDKKISEDIRDMERKVLQDATDKHSKKIDDTVKNKEKEVMTV